MPRACEQQQRQQQHHHQNDTEEMRRVKAFAMSTQSNCHEFIAFDRMLLFA